MEKKRRSGEKQRSGRAKHKQKKRAFSAKRIVIVLFSVVAAAAFSAMAVYLYLIVSGERMLKENIEKMHSLPEASIMYDRDGQEIYRLARENRDMAKLEEMHELLPVAFIAKEDQRFYDHAGIDLWSIGRAVVTDIMHGKFVEGGSTITQQLAKNLFLTSEKTLLRKATEASMAVALENNYDKDTILELYMNTIFFGQGTYGVKAASKVYFGKDDLKELELWEIATLAAIPKAPSYYNPITDPERSKTQRGIVLRLMHEQGYITKEQMEQAAKVDYVRPERQSNERIVNQAYIDFVLQEVSRRTKLTEEQLLLGGYAIHTTLDQRTQEIMHSTLSNADWYPKDGPEQQVESGMVIMDPYNGEIIAMFGGRGYVPRGTNRATERRQPGSSFKPLAVFAPALETGDWQPYSRLVDRQISFNGYTPKNYNSKYRGEVTMIDAVKDSINVPAVWLLNEIGIRTGMQYAESVGIEFAADNQDRNLSIALGGLTVGASVLEMAQAYTPFANQGEWTEAFAITKIVDAQGKLYYEHKPHTKSVMSPQNAWYMTLMLQQAVDHGTGQSARMNRPVAGKTGTTQYDRVPGTNKDVWFVGYTPEWVASVWMGFPRTDEAHHLTSGSGTPAKLFSEVLSRALDGRKAVPFEKPPGATGLIQPPKGVNDVAAVYVEEEYEVHVTWSKVAGDMTYHVYRKESSEHEFMLLTSTKEPIVRDASVKFGGTYQYYVVNADDVSGLEGPQSNTAEVKVPDLDDLIIDPGVDDDGDPGSTGDGYDEENLGSGYDPHEDEPGSDNDGIGNDSDQIEDDISDDGFGRNHGDGIGGDSSGGEDGGRETGGMDDPLESGSDELPSSRP